MNEEEIDLEYEVSSDNIFNDLGLENADELKSNTLNSIMRGIKDIEEGRITQLQREGVEEDQFVFGNGPVPD